MTVRAKSQDNRKTKEQLIHELRFLRKKIANLERLLDDRLMMYKEVPIDLCIFDLEEKTRALSAVNAQLLEEITERKRVEEALSFQATHDALTLLINRREFERRVARALDTARKRQAEHALCYLDLDHFKVINDTCGHMAGDELLRHLGQLLQASVRKRDTLARLGGDEFAILMEHCTLPQARRVANNLCAAVDGIRFVWKKRLFHIGASIGLVPVTESSESVANILSAADSACYAAKNNGRNRVHVYHRDDDTDLAGRQGETGFAFCEALSPE